MNEFPKMPHEILPLDVAEQADAKQIEKRLPREVDIFIARRALPNIGNDLDSKNNTYTGGEADIYGHYDF